MNVPRDLSKQRGKAKNEVRKKKMNEEVKMDCLLRGYYFCRKG
jgi:hypothetical protein